MKSRGELEEGSKLEEVCWALAMVRRSLSSQLPRTQEAPRLRTSLMTPGESGPEDR
jgi:hypothetical protein